MLKKKIAELFEKIKKTKTSTKIMILLPVISMLISTTAPFIPGLLENRIAFDAVSLFALSLIVLFMILLSITTLIISKKPGNTGISRDIRTEFTTDLLLSD